MLTVRSASLAEKSCKKMLADSSVRTVKLSGMAKALKNYRAWFPKKVSGRKLVVR